MASKSMFRCELKVPRYAASGVPFQARVDITGGPPNTPVTIRILRKPPAPAVEVAAVETLLTSDGDGYALVELGLDAESDQADGIFLTALARAGAETSDPDTDLVVVR